MTMQDEDYETATTKTDSDGTAPAIVPAPATVLSGPLVNPFVLFAQRNRSGGFFKGPLIKVEHTSGQIFRMRGEEKTLVEAGEQFTANVHELTDTWSKWINGKLVERRVYRAIAGEIAPEREALGDTDENYWPTRGSKPKDPWQRQVYLPMRGDDGEICAFVASGQSAISEIGELVGMYASADRSGKFPVIELDTRNFTSQHGSTIYVPVFRLVDWDFWELNTPAPPVELVPVPQTAAPAALTARKVTSSHTNTDTDTMSAPVKSQKKRGDTRSDLDDEIPF